MALKRLFNDLKECRPFRKDYQLKPKIRLDIDTRRFRCFILPTILYVPWIYRKPNVGLGIVEIKWLNFTIVIGEWSTRDVQEGETNGDK